MATNISGQLVGGGGMVGAVGAKGGVAALVGTGRSLPRSGLVYTTIEIQGLNTLQEHWATVAALVPPLTREVLLNTGWLMTGLAREMHRPHIRDQFTFRSIRLAGETPGDGFRGTGTPDVSVDGGSIYVDVIADSEGGRDPNFPAARLLEYGFVHSGSGKFVGPYPFMMPAADNMTPTFQHAMMQVAMVADQLPSTLASGPNVSGINQTIQRFRAGLYSTAKFLGDIAVFVPSPFLSRTRSIMYSTARGLGDLRAGMMGTLGGRFGRRVLGRFSGRGISAYRSTFLTASFGTGYQRIYNRLVGRELGQIALRRFD